MLGGQSRTPGPTLAANGPTLVASTLYYYVATKDGKTAEPNRVQVVTEKEQQSSQEKDTKAKKRVKSKEKQ